MTAETPVEVPKQEIVIEKGHCSALAPFLGVHRVFVAVYTCDCTVAMAEALSDLIFAEFHMVGDPASEAAGGIEAGFVSETRGYPVDHDRASRRLSLVFAAGIRS